MLRSIARARRLAVPALLTFGSAVLLAHEGHAPLPTRGAQVDAERGKLLLTADARGAIDVETAAVELRAMEERISAYASIVAPWSNHGFASSRLTGRIVRVSVGPGQTVKAGDVIAEIESIDLDTLQLDLLAAQNEIALSEKLVAELTRSAKAGAVAGQTVLDAEARLSQNRNAMELARSKWFGLGLVSRRLEEVLTHGTPLSGLTLPVTAPVSGTVVHAELTAGKVVEPSEHLAEIVDFSSVWVQIEVLEKDIHRVEVGTPLELVLAAYPGEKFRAAITARSMHLDPSTNVSLVWAELANTPGHEPRFRPGMSGQAQLIVSQNSRPGVLGAVTGSFGTEVPLADSRKPSLAVPVAAVLREGVERFVLVEEANTAGSSEYRRVPIVAGRVAEGFVEIVAGNLYPGDRVVTRGAHELGPFFTPTVLRPSPEAARSIALSVEPARRIAIDVVATCEGAVDLPPARRGFASSQLNGTVKAILVDRGQRVRAGQVVAEIFSPELLTLQQELLRVHLEDVLAADTLARLRKAGAGVAAQQVWELEGKLNGLRSQSATLRRKLITGGISSNRIDQLIADHRPIVAVPVRAPFDGALVNFDKSLGQSVAAHEPLFEIHDATRPPIRALVSERDISRVRIGQAVRVRLVADPTFTGTGRVVRSAGMFGVENRTQAVWVELDRHPDRPLLHGQLATLTVVLDRRPQAIAVPRSAIAYEGSTEFAFVRKPDGSFERRAVETGPSDDRFVTVTRGLAEGEPVAVSGVSELQTAFASLR
jgi:RND family efflux transporter MFP subunit